MNRAKSKQEKDQNKKIDYKRLKTQRTCATTFVWQTSFNDRRICEVVCTVTPEQINNHINNQLCVDEPQVYWAESSGWQDGLILANQLQYEYKVNAPSQSYMSDLDKLTPIEKYQGKPVTVTVTQNKVAWLKICKRTKTV